MYQKSPIKGHPGKNTVQINKRFNEGKKKEKMHVK